MAADNKGVAIRKRQQIDSSKKTMFIFVASAAFLAGIALVVSIFLIQQIVFHSKIIIEKQSTISRLDKNLKTIDELKKNNVKKIFLEVRKSNIPAISLYKKCGFIEIREIVDYYTNPKEDGIMMLKEVV